MTVQEYRQLPVEQQVAYHVGRNCPECKGPMVKDGHSTGALHTICPACDMCPDCEEGE